MRNCAQIPTTESQARELVGLTPDNQRKVWKEVIETAPNGVITAAYIRETRERLLGRRTNPEQRKLFSLDDYRKEITETVHSANRYAATANENWALALDHKNRAIELRDEAFKKFGVQLDLPFEFGDQNSD